MNIPEGVKFKDARTVISWRKSTSVFIDCVPELLPDQFKKIKIEPDKTEIKNILKAGGKIDGCKLVEKNNLQIK